MKSLSHTVTTTLLLLLVTMSTTVTAEAKKERVLCTPSTLGTNGCTWPTTQDVSELEASLSSGNRVLFWDGNKNTPRPTGMPRGGQPLHGLGRDGLNAMYHLNLSASRNSKLVQELRSGDCADLSGENLTASTETFCNAVFRNTPQRGTTPAFVVFALSANDVQQALDFARRFNFCVSVAGTGHDFMGRHSCPMGGVLIRTTLMRDKKFNPDDSRWQPSSPSATSQAGGTFTFGAGMAFSEAHKFAADNKRVVSSGWAQTVGIAGWSLGGGHGPLAPSLGVGADNIVEVRLVLANGTLVVASASSNPALYKALRGGGGSTFGVLVEMTVRAHKIPSGGFGRFFFLMTGTNCDKSRAKDFLGKYSSWAATRSKDWGGLMHVVSDPASSSGCVLGGWAVFLLYAHNGPNTTDSFKTGTASFSNQFTKGTFYEERTNLATWYDYILQAPEEPVTSAQWASPRPEKDELGGIPSAIVPRSGFVGGADSDFAKMAIAQLDQCSFGESCKYQVQAFHCLTGQLDSPQATETSLSPGMRSGAAHVILGGRSGTDVRKHMYRPEWPHSYFAESARNYESDSEWQERYWGASTYNQLLKVKADVDPEGVFWCRHCVGDTSTWTEPLLPGSSTTTPVPVGGETPAPTTNVTSSASRPRILFVMFLVAMAIELLC